MLSQSANTTMRNQPRITKRRFTVISARRYARAVHDMACVPPSVCVSVTSMFSTTPGERVLCHTVHVRLFCQRCGGRTRQMHVGLAEIGECQQVSGNILKTYYTVSQKNKRVNCWP